MGIIGKQSLRSSFFIYVGFAIGAFNVLYLFPKYLTQEEFGLTRLLQDVSLLIAMFCTLGSSPAMVKFYPFYKSFLPQKKNDLPVLGIIACIAGCVLFAVTTPFTKDLIAKKFGARSALFVDYFFFIYPMVISYCFWYLFESISFSIQRTVLPNFLKEVGFRLITTLFVTLYAFKIISFSVFIWLFSFVYTIPVIILFIYLCRQKIIRITFSVSSVTRRLGKQIILFSAFVFSGQVLNVVAKTVDTIVISSQSINGLADTAVFTIATYLVSMMDVPMRGMNGIASTVIAYAWKDRNMAKIKDIYEKTALNLAIAGAGIFCILLLNQHNAVSYLGSRYAALPSLLLVLGIAKMIDLSAGLNAQILLSSKYWRIDFISNMLLVVLSIPLNVFLVKKFNVMGAAYATVIALTVYNVARFIAIWYIFKLQPFNNKNFLTLFFAAVAFGIAYVIPSFKKLIPDAAIRTLAFSTVYLTLILKFKVSTDIWNIFEKRLTAPGKKTN
jgi:O-antigen/teichoic acid export membrane protein